MRTQDDECSTLTHAMTITVNFICVKHDFSGRVGRVLCVQVPSNAAIPILMEKILEKAQQMTASTIASTGGNTGNARVYQLTPPLGYSGSGFKDIVWGQQIRREMGFGVMKQLGNWPRGYLHALVQLPGESAAPVALPLYENYASCFSTVDGSDSESSLVASRITVVEAADTRYKHSHHYANFKARLEAKRDVHTNYKETFENALGAEVFKQRYNCIPGVELSDELDYEMGEIKRILHPKNNKLLLQFGWTVHEAIPLFFYPFVRYCDSYFHELAPGCGFSWPIRNVFNLKKGNILERKQNHPRDDFNMTFAGVIRLMVEVKSSGNVYDESQLLCQAAFLVRLLDKNLEEMGFEPDSVLLAYYLDSATIHRFLIYENRDVNQVLCVDEERTNEPRNRARVLQELYNLVCMAKEDASKDWDKLRQLTEQLKLFSISAEGLPHVPSRRMKRGWDDDLAGQPHPKKSNTVGDSLEVDGYECMKALHASSSNKGLLVFVIRQKFNGEKFVLKINHDPGEQEILEFLHSRIPPSECIIPLLRSLSTNLGPGILLPLQQPVLDLLAHPGPHYLHFIQFAEDVIAGVMFLHGHNVAHRDIKPENLVYTDTFRVQIIDFELAIHVQGEDDTIEDDVGTDDYRAPETYDPYDEGRPKRYSPIRADRWSCGRVVLEVLSRLDHIVLCPDLFSFARRLHNDNPMDRPPLVEWMKDEGKDGKSMVSGPVPQ